VAIRSLDFDRPLVSVDLAIFAISDEALRVLLVTRPQESTEPYPGKWALPGGFVDISEDSDLDSCARRKLEQKTGVVTSYLEQVGAWGDAKRDPRGWSITQVYFSLISADDVKPVPGGNAADARWVNVDNARICNHLAFDHTTLLMASLARLRSKVEYTSLPAFLMAREFTLAELQHVYEVLLGRKLEKKAFRTRVLATKLLEATPRYREGANRPAQLYRLQSRREPVFFSRAIEGTRN
jgi:8-oxo-dGTP diphosphatase